MNDKPLTQRQTEALEIIKSFVAQNGYPPTVRELADKLVFNLLRRRSICWSSSFGKDS